MSLSKYFKDVVTSTIKSGTYASPIKIDDYLLNTKQKVLSGIRTATDKELKKWKREVESSISDPLPKRLLGHKRPSGRYFPYTNPYSKDTNLKDTISTNIEVDKTVVGASMTFEFNMGSDHSTLTTYGFTRKGIGTSKGNWAGWVDKVFTANKYHKVRGAEPRMHKAIVSEMKHIDKYIT